MITHPTGLFVSIDGPSGVGKTTAIGELRALLPSRGVMAQWTTEPPPDFLGDFTRAHSGQLSGLSLTCLVAAARYQHIHTTIQPALDRGELLTSDRYLASTLVLQRLDGVSLDFLLTLNDQALVPDLSVILTASPDTIASRIRQAGTDGAGLKTPRGTGEDRPARLTISPHSGARVRQPGQRRRRMSVQRTPANTGAAAMSPGAGAALPLRPCQRRLVQETTRRAGSPLAPPTGWRQHLEAHWRGEDIGPLSRPGEPDQVTGGVQALKDRHCPGGARPGIGEGRGGRHSAAAVTRRRPAPAVPGRTGRRRGPAARHGWLRARVTTAKSSTGGG